MSTTKHLALQKFETVDVALRGPITPRQAASSANSGIVSTNAVDKAAQFPHAALFCSLEPGVQSLCLPFFEQGHKFLAQQVDGAEFLIQGDLFNLLLLHLGEL